jgi:hypothetical protein
MPKKSQINEYSDSSAHSKLAGEKTAMKSVAAAPLVLENVTVTQALDSACAQ